MAAVFYLLSKHPEVQDKAFEELQTLFANDIKREATYKDLNDMKYLEMVIKESLRLYPSAPIISKELLEDYEFSKFIYRNGDF